MSETTFDLAIVGAGVIGASIAYFTAPRTRIVLLEAEDQPGYHASGRSAAQFIQTYGGDIARRLTRIAQPFLERPPQGFSPRPLLHRRGTLVVASADQHELLREQALALADCSDHLVQIDGAAARRLCPALRPEKVAAALWEPGTRPGPHHRWLFLGGRLRRVRRADLCRRGTDRGPAVDRVDHR